MTKVDTNLPLQRALGEGGTWTRESQTCGLLPWARLGPPMPMKVAFPGTTQAVLSEAMQGWASKQARQEERGASQLTISRCAMSTAKLVRWLQAHVVWVLLDSTKRQPWVDQ